LYRQFVKDHPSNEAQQNILRLDKHEIAIAEGKIKAVAGSIGDEDKENQEKN
jgi:hypothetical protein